ncbi:MAG: hypothetical protein AAF636_02845 [Pseudomonadota bacterium]
MSDPFGKASVRRQYHVGARHALRFTFVSASLALLVACAPRQTETPLRDPEAPFGATTRFDAVAFGGDWQVVASSAPGLTGVLSVSADGMDLTLPGGAGRPYALASAGVYQSGNGSRMVVMWVDETFRTAVVGRADGAQALLLSRTNTVPSDKRAAAFDVFDFYGWDTSRIKDRA